MGTRGLYGFYKDGITKTAYNQYDSYPSQLGIKMLNLIKETSIEELNEIFKRIKLVKENRKPTKKQTTTASAFVDPDLSVSNRTIEDWYCVLREAQNNPNIYKTGLPYMLDAQDFIKDSLFCEWAYIINLNDNTLEVYSGFVKEMQTNMPNRYMTDRPEDGYYPCKLIKIFKLEFLRDVDNISEPAYVEMLNKASE